MKKVFLAIMAMTMLVATSCKKESINAPENLNPGKGEFLVTIANGIKSNAPAAKGDMSTKTTIDVNNIIWSEGDVISIKSVDEDQSFEYVTHTPGGTVIFSPVTEGQEAEGESFEAFYPSNLMSIGLPSTIEYDGGELKNLPMYATSAGDDNHTLVFHNICAAIKIKVPVACNKIVISANENIAGNITISYDIDKDKYKAVFGSTGASNTITITNGKGNGFSQPGVLTDSLVYVAIPDGTYNNFTIKLYGEDDVLCGDRTISKPLTLNVNNLYNLTFNTSTPLDVPLDMFCFTADEDGTIAHNTNSGRVIFQYRKDDESGWTNFTMKNSSTPNTVSIKEGHKIYIKAISFQQNTGAVSYRSKFESSNEVTVSGNIMYLLNPKGEQKDLDNNNENAFKTFFDNMVNLTDASKLILPNSVSTNCYYSMFNNCSKLKSAPTLPAASLAANCYWSMFQGCSMLSAVTSATTNVTATNCLASWLGNVTPGSNTAGKDVSSPTLTIDSNLDATNGVGKNIADKVPTNWTITNGSTIWKYNTSTKKW